MNNSKPFAEVVESSLNSWLAQSWEWDHFPRYGSLVTIDAKNRTLFGIVHQVQTGSMDPVRYPFAYKKTEEELLQEQPQIFEFLKTTFSCLSLGYRQKGRMFYTLPPEPAKIHAFVYPAAAEISKEFLFNDTYLHTLFGSALHIINVDELLLAILQEKARLQVLSEPRIQSFMHTYSLLTGNDYRRIKLFMLRAQHIVEQQHV